MEYNYTGMPVSKRLFNADLFGAFGKAVAERDRASLEEVLRKVDLDEKSMKMTIEQYLPSGR